jgi:hypothetical protein
MRPSQDATAKVKGSWKIMCLDSDGKAAEKVSVTVDRGDSVNLKDSNLRKCPKRSTAKAHN